MTKPQAQMRVVFAEADKSEWLRMTHESHRPAGVLIRGTDPTRLDRLLSGSPFSQYRPRTPVLSWEWRPARERRTSG